MAQVKVLLTSPKPISSGGMMMDSGMALGSVDGIALFSDTGDVVGAAVVSGTQVNVQFTSPKGTFGAIPGYPLMTVTTSVPSTALPGQTFGVSLNSSSSWWQDLLGLPIPVELKPGTFTVGGSVSITNVVPGGGALAPGGTFRVLGMGFSTKTRVQMNPIKASSITLVSPNELLVSVKDGGLLDGNMIQVVNPDNSSDTYYSYLRGIPVGQSSRPLLTHTVPVFSISTGTDATFPPTISPQLNPDYFTGVAFQNPAAVPALITIESHNSGGALTGSAAVTLPSGGRISREVSELLGTTLPIGSYLHVTSTQPVQMLGLLGNDKTGIVLPVAFAGLSPAIAPSATTAATGGGGG